MDAIISHPLSAIAIPIGMPFFSLSGDMHRSVWRCIWLLTSTRIVHTETSTQRVLIEPFAGLDPIRAFAIDSKRIFEPSSRLRSCYRASLYWTPDAAPKEQRIEIWLRNCATCQGFGLAGSDKLKKKVNFMAENFVFEMIKHCLQSRSERLRKFTAEKKCRPEVRMRSRAAVLTPAIVLLLFQRCCDSAPNQQQPYNCPKECICLSSTQVSIQLFKDDC